MSVPSGDAGSAAVDARVEAVFAGTAQTFARTDGDSLRDAEPVAVRALSDSM